MGWNIIAYIKYTFIAAGVILWTIDHIFWDAHSTVTTLITLILWIGISASAVEWWRKRKIKKLTNSVLLTSWWNPPEPYYVIAWNWPKKIADWGTGRYVYRNGDWVRND